MWQSNQQTRSFSFGNVPANNGHSGAFEGGYVGHRLVDERPEIRLYEQLNERMVVDTRQAAFSSENWGLNSKPMLLKNCFFRFKSFILVETLLHSHSAECHHVKIQHKRGDVLPLEVR